MMRPTRRELATLGTALLLCLSTTTTLAQGEPEAWSLDPDVPGLDRLEILPSFASDGSGVVLTGTSIDGPEALAWHSADGVTWQSVELPGAEGAIVTSVAFGPAGYVAVGYDQDRGRIWHSPTGEVWSGVGQGLADDGGILDVAATPTGYTAVGAVREGNRRRMWSVPTVWRSADGQTWESATLVDVREAGATSITTAPDGSLLATVILPAETRGRGRRARVVRPSSLAFATSSDGAAWEIAEAPFVEDLAHVTGWELASAGGRILAQTVRAPNAPSDVTDGYQVSTDGTTWEREPVLQGLTGTVTGAGEGLTVIGSGPVLSSEDGTTWHSSYDDALASVIVRAATVLPDGRILAVGMPQDGSTDDPRMFAGPVSPVGPALPTDCLDAALATQLTDTDADLAAMAPADRELLAASLGALELADTRAASLRDRLVSDLRVGGAVDPPTLFPLYSGEVSFPACA